MRAVEGMKTLGLEVLLNSWDIILGAAGSHRRHLNSGMPVFALQEGPSGPWNALG